MKTTCSSCNKSIEISDDYAGMAFDCPLCGAENIAPEKAKNKFLDMSIDEGDFIPEPFTRAAAAIHDEIVEDEEPIEINKQLLVIAGVSLIIAILLQIFYASFLWTIYIPLYIVTLVIGYIHWEKEQKKIALTILISTLMSPIIIVSALLIFSGTNKKDTQIVELKKTKKTDMAQIIISSRIYHDSHNALQIGTIPVEKVAQAEKEVEEIKRKNEKITQKANLPKKSNSKISSAFGFTLGDVLANKLIIKKISNVGNNLYQVKGTPFREFKEVYVSISPKSRKIHSIMAKAHFDELAKAAIEQQNITILLEKKYNEKMTQPTFSKNNNHMLIHEDRYIVTRIVDNTLEIIYNDETLQGIASKEQFEELKIKKAASDLL